MVYLMGTEPFYDNVEDPEDYIEEVCHDLYEVWKEALGTSHMPSFAVSHGYIPEEELSRQSLYARMADASEWHWWHRTNQDFVGSLQVLDWVDDRREWPYGEAYTGNAMTKSPYQAGITNFYPFLDGAVGYFFREMGVFGILFHELLHTYDAEHWHGATSTDDRTTVMLPEERGAEDKSCLFFGENYIRHPFVSPCTLSTVHSHIREHMSEV